MRGFAPLLADFTSEKYVRRIPSAVVLLAVLEVVPLAAQNDSGHVVPVVTVPVRTNDTAHIFLPVELAVRVGAGPAYADQAGVAGLVGVELLFGVLVLRAGSRLLIAGDGFTGGLVGAAMGFTYPTVPLRPYILATLAYGVDIGELDSGDLYGVVLGIAGSRLFAEMRYERLTQRREIASYHDLAEKIVTALVGLRIRLL